MKTEERDDSSNFQRFLDSASIEVDEFNDFNLPHQPTALPLFYARHAVLLSAQSSWPQYEVEQITTVEKSANSAGSVFRKCNRHFLG